MRQSEPEVEQEAEKQAGGESGVVSVKLTEIYTGSTFAVHINGPAASSGEFSGRGSDVLAELESAMATRADELALSSLGSSPRKGALLACLHDDPTQDEGSAWIRARVEEVAGGVVKVYFIDYGHRSALSLPLSLPPLISAGPRSQHPLFAISPRSWRRLLLRPSTVPSLSSG
jgi:hypothetical protein